VTVPDPDLAALLPSWELALRAERKSPQTGKTYGDGVPAYLRLCDANDRPAVLSRRQLAGFVDALLSDGAQPLPGRVPLISTTARGLRHDRAPRTPDRRDGCPRRRVRARGVFWGSAWAGGCTRSSVKPG